jgi:hypothetical protein
MIALFSLLLIFAPRIFMAKKSPAVPNEENCFTVDVVVVGRAVCSEDQDFWQQIYTCIED